jgi:RNA polymerase sigma-70 factor, ECF subfamily
LATIEKAKRFLTETNVNNDQLKTLIKECAKGSRVAQEKLFKAYFGKMMGVCLRYTKDQDQAQEVVQIGFIKVFDKLGEFDFQGSFEGWMRRIMVNASIDAIRKKSRGPISTDEDYYFDKPEEDDGSLDDALLKLKAEHAMRAIQQLSPAYKTVFNLYVIENYSHKEIAEILNISEGTSKSNLAKAKQNLREILLKEFKKLKE